MNLLVIDRKSLVTFRADGFATADKIAAYDGLGAEAIEHAIEQYGRCDGYEYTIIPEEWQDKENK